MPGTTIGRGTGLFDAVLLDRDGTLIEDVPYNGDPDKVRPLPGAREALARLRAAGFALGVITNQSGLARGCFTGEQLRRVNARVEELLGPFDTWQVCPHDDRDGCHCRKPAPGLVIRAAAALGTRPARCVVIGDIGRDMTAALAAGATGVLVPTPVTRAEEVAAAPAVAVDLPAAVEKILHRQDAVLPAARPNERAGTVLIARNDSAGDMLVTGPAIRAVAGRAARVVLLCGPRGRAAAELLPGIDELIEWSLEWIDPAPGPIAPDRLTRLVARLGHVNADEAIIFTSFHQSALPLALLLRMAGITRVSAISEDYPGSLLDVRHRVPPGVPEPERALSLAAAAGFPLPAGDDAALRLRPEILAGPGGVTPWARPGGQADRVGKSSEPGYIVLHPGSSVPARACPPQCCADIVTALQAAGYRVVVTGDRAERALTARVASAGALDLGGRTGLPELARVIADARCMVVGNTGPAHLAAAVGTPVISLFAPTVPFGQWAPYRVPLVRLGDATAACRDSRATDCPVPGHPCLAGIDPAKVVDAVRLVTAPSPACSAP